MPRAVSRTRTPRPFGSMALGLQRLGTSRDENLPATWKGWDDTGRPMSFEEWPISRVLRRERFQDQILRAMRVETGQEFYASYNGCPMVDANGRLTFGFITIREITEQRKTEMALRELNATLESKVAQRTAQLQRRAKQLQRLTLELTQAEERERRRIAVILHEDLQQQMAGAKFHLHRIRGQVKDDRLRADIEEVGEILKSIAGSALNGTSISPMWY